MTDTLDQALKARRVEVAQHLVAVGKSLDVFNHGKRQYLSKAVERTMKDAEQAFANCDYDRAEHLVLVIAAMVKREAPIFAADPDKWVDKIKASAQQ